MASGQPPPLQPFEFLAWLVHRVCEAGIPCRAARFRGDGSLGLFVEGSDGPRWAWWRPPPPGEPEACLPGGVPGVIEAQWLPPEAQDALARAVAVTASHPGAVMVAFGPGPGIEVPVTVEGLGDLLQRQIRPGLTRWGPFVARSLDAPAQGMLRVSFSADGGPRVVLDIRLDLTGGGRAAVMHIERVEDTRTEAQRRSLDHRVEHLVGFAVARALGRGARPVLAVKTSASARPRGGVEAPPRPLGPGHEPVAACPEPLATRLTDGTLPFDVPPDLFFRFRNAGFVSNTMVLLSPGWVSLVCHGNRECTSGIPRVRGAPTLSTLVPWPRDAEDPWGPRVTDFDDEAVLRGGQERLRDAVEQAASDGRSGPVLVAEMCDYHQLAEATGATLREGVAGSPRPGVCFDVMVTDRDILAASNNRWRSLLPPLFEAGPARSAREGVALVGFGDPGLPAIRELRDLLATLGVPVRAVMFPYLEEADARALRDVGLFVVSPWDMVRRGLGEVLDALGVPVLRAPGPWGVGPTRRWLAAVLEAADLPAPSQGLSPAPVVLDQWEAIRRRAREVPVAFPVPRGGLCEALAPEFFNGFSPLDLLTDLGFRAVVLAPFEPGLPASVSTADGEVPVEAVREGESTADALARLGCPLAYSEYEADPRVLRAGAMPFSVTDLEPGFAGALRTARRLLRRATAARFFREYGDRVSWDGC